MCHQTVSLTARHLEENGLPTVVLGSALDIVEHCSVPRFAFVDFPLGNPCGKPFDAAMQREIVAAAVDLFDSATEYGHTARLPYRWSADESWRDGYMAIGADELAELQRKGEQRRAHRQALRDTGRVRAE